MHVQLSIAITGDQHVETAVVVEVSRSHVEDVGLVDDSIALELVRKVRAVEGVDGELLCARIA